MKPYHTYTLFVFKVFPAQLNILEKVTAESSRSERHLKPSSDFSALATLGRTTPAAMSPPTCIANCSRHYPAARSSALHPSVLDATAPPRRPQLTRAETPLSRPVVAAPQTRHRPPSPLASEHARPSRSMRTPPPLLKYALGFIFAPRSLTSSPGTPQTRAQVPPLPKLHLRAKFAPLVHPLFNSLRLHLLRAPTAPF